jgi:16S rRNA (guanine(966)-N(2))-methyltransferase RsmD
MSTVRITGGDLRGRKVLLPRKHELRPTSDKARQAFFNIVGPRVFNATFLDLFSGTGVFSFEALSRGAARSVAVEKSPAAATQIAASAENLSVDVAVMEGDVLNVLRGLPEDLTFDIVYADPPYDFDAYPQLIEAIDSRVSLSGGALVAIEHRSGEEIEDVPTTRLTRTRTAKYGSVSITMFENS